MSTCLFPKHSCHPLPCYHLPSHFTYPRVYNGSIAPIRDLVHMDSDMEDFSSPYSRPAKCDRGRNGAVGRAVSVDLQVEGKEGGRMGGDIYMFESSHNFPHRMTCDGSLGGHRLQIRTKDRGICRRRQQLKTVYGCVWNKTNTTKEAW